MDKLLLLNGAPYALTPNLTINNPTLRDIRDFSEEKYFSIVSALTATAYDYRVQLDDIGKDYVGISDYEMFLMLVPTFEYAETKILLPTVCFEQLEMGSHKETGEIALVEKNVDFLGNVKDCKVIIDRYIYHEMVDYIRYCHGIERRWLVPGNKGARRVLIDDERERQQNEKNKPFKSILESRISALCNLSGSKYDYESIWDLSIYQFLDAIRRIEKIRASDHAYMRINSGFFDIKKANKKQLNKELDYLGEF